MAANINERIKLWGDYWTLQGEIAEMEEALAIFEKNLDLEGALKERAATSYRLVLVFLWYIVMYQLVVMMFLYYKRLITVSVLIIIFPLIMAFYAFEKFMGIDKPAGYSTWIKEFLANVFVQCVHAMLYVTLVETGLKLYESDSDNWLLLLLSITILMPMENIMKSILGLKGSTVANMGDSAKKGAAVVGGAVATAKLARQGHTNKDKENERKNINAREKDINKKNATKDKKEQAKRNKQDQKLQQKVERGEMSADDAKKLQKQRDEKRSQKDETKKKKRAAAKKRREASDKRRKTINNIRTVAAVGTSIATTLAAGGDPEDMAVGNAVGKMIAPSVKPNTDAKSDKGSDSKGGKDASKPKTPANTTVPQGQGGNNAQGRNNPTQAANNANNATRNADNGAGRNGNGGNGNGGNVANPGTQQNPTQNPAADRAPTAAEAKQANQKSQLQDSFREEIAARVKSNTHINETDE